MSQRTLDEHLRDHYARARLRPELRERLLSEAALRDTSARRTRRFAWAASIGLLLVVGAWALWPPIGSGDVAREIAWNHTTQFQVDVAVCDPAALAARLDRLDFSPVWGERLAAIGARLVGARYCSLGGQLAAQLVVEGAEGERMTLYQTRDSDALRGVADGRYADGEVQVELWRESGVLLGLARN